MEKLFKKVDGSKVNLESYVRKMIESNPLVRVHVGTDSQVYGNQCKYATVVAFRLPNTTGTSMKGVHYIVSKYQCQVPSSDWERLWKETELSMEVAMWLNDNIPGIIIEIDFDFNENEKYLSNKLIGASRGWARASGFIVNTKSNHNRIAAFAADYQCR